MASALSSKESGVQIGVPLVGSRHLTLCAINETTRRPSAPRGFHYSFLGARSAAARARFLEDSRIPTQLYPKRKGCHPETRSGKRVRRRHYGGCSSLHIEESGAIRRRRFPQHNRGCARRRAAGRFREVHTGGRWGRRNSFGKRNRKRFGGGWQ